MYFYGSAWTSPALHMQTLFPFLNAGIFLCRDAAEDDRLLRAVPQCDSEGARNGSSRILRFHQGEKPPPLEPHEYKNPLTRLRASMQARDVDACVFISTHNNVAYYSGFLYCAFG